ncbi:MAG: hypothetical protein GWN20_27425, partial [Phycisphaerae bacterium]|nr:hypothetical protein [Phycisphaerae bacterium]
ISFLALVLALGIVQLVFPYFKEILGDRIYLEYYQYDTFMLELIGVTLLAGIIAGSYPAFFLSSYKPVQTLKGNFNVTAEGRSSALRKVLVVFQFAIAIILIINTGIVVDQINYIQNRDLGYNTNQVVYLTLRSNEERGKIEVLRSELLKNPRVVSVAASAGLSGASGSQGTVTVAGTNGEQSIMMRRSYVDFDFINTLGMQIVEGRNFSQEFATDTSRAVIINQAAARELGWNDPLGRQFEGSEHNLSVIGVVKDFNFYKLTEKIEPLIMQIVPERFSFLLIKIRPENIPGTLDFIEQTWNAHLPGRPYDYDFLNEHFARLYKSEQNTGKLFGA